MDEADLQNQMKHKIAQRVLNWIKIPQWFEVIASTRFFALAWLEFAKLFHLAANESFNFVAVEDVTNLEDFLRL